MKLVSRRCTAYLCVIIFLGGALLTSVRPIRGADQELTGAAAIRFELAKLNVLGSVLMIGAHPDDENTGVIAYLARGRKLRTGYLSLTRGEGGQNLLGNEQGAYLGALRTQELLAARRLDGASQYFTRAIDFGFTKTASETMAKWGHDRILSDIVWVIRQQQPDVILLCFSGTPADGHGQHQVSAILGREAFDAAADPGKFPEQLKWVKTWQARRLMQARFTPPSGGAAFGTFGGSGGAARGGRGASGGDGRGTAPVAGELSLPVGDYDPVLGKSYREIAVSSRSEHKSQAMVQSMAFGEQSTVLAPVGGTAPSGDLLDGIDASWNRVPGGAQVGKLLAAAQREFDDLHPEETVAALLDARALVVELVKSGQQWPLWKLDEINEAIALCAGLRVEAQADTYAYVPGAAAEVKLTAINRSHLPLVLTGIHVDGWGARNADVNDRALAYNREEAVNLKLTVPRIARIRSHSGFVMRPTATPT